MSPRERSNVNRQQNNPQEVPVSHQESTIPSVDESFYNVADDLNPPYVDEEGERRPQLPKPREPVFWFNLIHESTGLKIPEHPFDFKENTPFTFGTSDKLYPRSTRGYGGVDIKTMDTDHDTAEEFSHKCNVNVNDGDDNNSFHGNNSQTEDSSIPSRPANVPNSAKADKQENTDDDSGYASDSSDDYLHSDSESDLEDIIQRSSHFAKNSYWHYTRNLGYDADDEHDLSGDEDGEEQKSWTQAKKMRAKRAGAAAKGRNQKKHWRFGR